MRDRLGGEAAGRGDGPGGEGRGGGDGPNGGDLAPGVRALDHTADVGYEVRADSLPELFRRSASGMLALLYEDEATEGPAGDALRPVGAGSAGGATSRDRGPGPSRVAPESSHVLELEAADPPALLADWLRELLYLHEVHGLDYRGVEFVELGPARLRAEVRLAREQRMPVRELKGVTYHGLALDEQPDGWRAVVIFDV